MDINLVQKLKDWRNEKARQEGKQPYLVFQNAALEATVDAMPGTKEELLKIKGWGARKVQKYGDEVLAMLKGNQGNHRQSISFENNFNENQNKNMAEVNLAYQDILNQQTVFSVADFLAYFNGILSGIGQVKIKGEISDLSSGRQGSYAFFDLKDSSGKEAVVKCFAGFQAFSKFSHIIENGAEVVISGFGRVYEKSGGFSITVTNVEPVGEGAWKKAFEMLKKKLEAKGYFDQSRKRPLPFYVQKIGLVTSEHGAAIKDFLKNLGGSGFEIYFKDVFVEGDYAEKSIVSALGWMNRNMPDLDVIVLVRGGGGIESFKAFNSEAVADAIVSSRIPVITGIGHEKDQSIADFASDKFFSTPTAVGIHLREQRRIIEEAIEAYSQQLAISAQRIVIDFSHKIENSRDSLVLSCDRIINSAKYKLANLTEKIHNGANRVTAGFQSIEQNFLKTLYSYEGSIHGEKHKIDKISNNCRVCFENSFSQAVKKIDNNENLLYSLNPESILKRGYSIVYSKEGLAVKKSEDVEVGELLDIRLSEGSVVSRVESK